MKCNLCYRPVKDKGTLCIYHQKALDNLKTGFEKWKAAYAGTPRKIRDYPNYLRRLSYTKQIGPWVLETINMELGVEKKMVTVVPEEVG